MKKGKILLSGLLSLAAFSVFTNVNAESYTLFEAPDSFTTNAAGHSVEGSTTYMNPGNDAVLGNVKVAAAAGQQIIDYHTRDNKKVFCIDRKTTYNVAGATYTKKDAVADQVLAYIVGLSDSFYTDNFAATAAATADTQLDYVKKYEQAWLTQAAIWKYNSSKNLTEDNFASLTIASGDEGIILEDGINGADGLYYRYSNRADKLWLKVDELINLAKTAAAKANDADEKLTFAFEGSYELDKDTKTIKTGLIKMSNSNVGTYSLDLSKAPSGTKVYNSKGEEITVTANITDNQFYLEFPIENVENYSFDFDIGSMGNTNGGVFKGYEYINEGNQPLMLVVQDNKILNGAINFKGSHIDDTASMISRSIYFVGFLILIAGVGMIYINVKPKKEQEI